MFKNLFNPDPNKTNEQEELVDLLEDEELDYSEPNDAVDWIYSN
jgi:hypothetical protein